MSWKAPGETKQRIREILMAGSASIPDLERAIGIDEAGINRHLKQMMAGGEVDRTYSDRRLTWFLVNPPPPPEPEIAPTPTPPIESDRVSLVRELLEIEQMMAEAAVRKNEILEALQ